MTLDAHPRAASFLALLEARLKPKLVRHCIGVAETLLSLAPLAELEPMRCIEAGLLHDSCKHHKKAGYLAEAERVGLVVSPIAREHPMLLHGPLAAVEARHLHAIEDEDLYQALFWHTTGRPGLCLLGLGLIVADFSEPNRDYAEAEEARSVLQREGFDAALRFVAEHKLRFVQRKAAVDPETAAFHAWVMAGRPPC